MSKKDQRMIKSKKWSRAIIKHNTARLKDIIKKYGRWPSSKFVGLAGESAAWLIAQHSDYDVKFQECCLKLLKKLPPTKQRKIFIAYLIDRILVNRNAKQIYGTQFFKGKPRPIKNIAHLDLRRKKMNLEPFAVYQKHMKKVSKFF